MSKPNTSPVYVHDCQWCTFLGHAVVDGKAYDFYCCDHSKHPELIDIIARYGNGGGDYSSTLSGYVSPLSITGMLGFSLYARHKLEANGASGFWRGMLFKDNQLVLDLRRED